MATLSEYLHGMYDNVYSTINYIYAPSNECSVLLMAHCDTVFKLPPTKNDILYDRERNIMISREGGLGDDRAGVYAILKLLEQGYRPSVLFTNFEESGCLGSAQLIKDFTAPASETNFIIQIDRRGINDMVFYQCDNKEFIEYIGAFGFTKQGGSFTDISTICPAWGVAGVNLSTGYDGEHDTSEILIIDALESTIEKVSNILKEKEHPYFKYIESAHLGYTFLNSSWYDDYDSYNPSEYTMVCDCCHSIVDKSDVIPVIGPKGTALNICLYCLDGEDLEWCQECGSPFIGEHDTDTLCYSCRNKGQKRKCKKKKSRKSKRSSMK